MAPFGVPAWSRGPVVPSGPVARPQPGLKSLLGDSRIGGSGAPFGVPAWSRGPVGPVVPSGLSLSSSLFAVWGPRSGIMHNGAKRTKINAERKKNQ